VHRRVRVRAPNAPLYISFYCDDINETVQTLRKRGVEFKQKVEDRGCGLVTYFKVPAGFAVQLYDRSTRRDTSSSKALSPI
jgi:hypothetical protein